MTSLNELSTFTADEDGFSDDSSFYGDSPTRSHLSDLASSFSCSFHAALRHRHQRLDPNYLAASGLVARSLAIQHTADLWVPGADELDHRQLSETPYQFVERMSPSSPIALQYPWLWVHNPHLGQHHSYYTRGQDLAAFLGKGRKVLDDLSRQRAELERGSSKTAASKAAITRKLGPARKAASRAIHEAAKDCGIRSGKWLLFSPVSNPDISKTWLKVVKGVVAGELGCAAKIGRVDSSEGPADSADAKKTTDGGNSGGGKSVICVYTEDFDDGSEVQHVLEALRKKKIAAERATLAYKSDAMTHLGVYTNNEWKVSATLYSSKDFER